jgi:hypothetical protein
LLVVNARLKSNPLSTVREFSMLAAFHLIWRPSSLPENCGLAMSFGQAIHLTWDVDLSIIFTDLNPVSWNISYSWFSWIWLLLHMYPDRGLWSSPSVTWRACRLSFSYYFIYLSVWLPQNQVHYYCGHLLAYSTSPGLWRLWSNWWNERVTGETGVLGDTLPQCRCPPKNPHCLTQRPETGPPPWKPATNCLSYGTACISVPMKNFNHFFCQISKMELSSIK